MNDDEHHPPVPPMLVKRWNVGASLVTLTFPAPAPGELPKGELTFSPSLTLPLTVDEGLELDKGLWEAITLVSKKTGHFPVSITGDPRHDSV